MKPDIARMLPTQARAALKDYFLAKLKASPLDYRVQPTYTEDHALQEFNEALEFGFHRTITRESYLAARAAYETEHRLSWDNENQKAYRLGLPKP